MRALIDIAGQRFGRLVALSYLGKSGAFKWRCICDCGVSTSVAGFRLRSGDTRSCGCLDRETVIERNTTHGMSKWPEYKVYQGMLKRCKGVGENAHYYTDRGISVCDRWTNGDGAASGFECFIADVGRRPSADHSIDREDNNGNYEPGNCRWATVKTQARNRRGRRMVTYEGREMCVAEAAELADIPYDVVSDRLNRLNWTLEEALAKKSVGRWS